MWVPLARRKVAYRFHTAVRPLLLPFLLRKLLWVHVLGAQLAHDLRATLQRTSLLYRIYPTPHPRAVWAAAALLLVFSVLPLLWPLEAVIFYWAAQLWVIEVTQLDNTLCVTRVKPSLQAGLERPFLVCVLWATLEFVVLKRAMYRAVGHTVGARNVQLKLNLRLLSRLLFAIFLLLRLP